METQSTLQQFFMFMGPWRWPLILLSLIVLVLILNGIYQYFIRKSVHKAALHNLIFWGGLTGLVGILAQISGIWQALNEIIKAPDISPAIVLIGFMSSFTTTLFGLIVLIIAALCWWGLKFKANQIIRNS